MSSVNFAAFVHDVPDFPKPGIVFKDIAPLLAAPHIFAEAIDCLATRCKSYAPDGIIAIESRGFLLGAPLAKCMRLPLIMVRKPGKLPGPTVRHAYTLEYGSDCLEIQQSALTTGGRYAVVDDVLATGGTVEACAQLVTNTGAMVCTTAFLIELCFLGGSKKLGCPVEALITYS